MGDMQGPDMAGECRAACAEKREVRCATDGPQTAVDIRAEKGRATTRDCDGARSHAAHTTARGHFSSIEFADRRGAPGPDTANGRANALAAIALLVLFALWTWAVSTVDVRPIGPGGSHVGLASLNEAFHRWTGVHMGLYLATDWLSLVPVGCVLGFGALGLVQLVQRRSLLRVDRDLLMLGVFYVVSLFNYAARYVCDVHDVSAGHPACAPLCGAACGSDFCRDVCAAHGGGSYGLRRALVERCCGRSVAERGSRAGISGGGV